MPQYTLKVANMKKAQKFTLYPYNGGYEIHLQSNKRFIQANLRTGEAYINKFSQNYANSLSLILNPLKFELPEEIKLKIQSYLWHNEGKNGSIGGVLFFENKELFSATN